MKKLEEKLNSCMVSQQIREMIGEGRLVVPSPYESRIRPSFYDTSIGDEIFIIDTEKDGLFRPNADETVYRTLIRELPAKKRQRIDISGGFELNKDFTYMIPLEEKIRLIEGEHVRASSKSSIGRVFLNTRLVADYNPCFDEVNYHYLKGKEANLWLFVQPLAFNVIVYPGMALNRLRFFKGYGAQMTPRELAEEYSKKPMLYVKEGPDREVPAEPVITEGLELHLDLAGEYTSGVVGFRARHNPTAIDLRKNAEYKPEDFFEPIKAGRNIALKRGEYYLFSSLEIFRVPDHVNMLLKQYSHVGFRGPAHFAADIDNGFEGNLVFEVCSDEMSDMELKHNMPFTKVEVFTTGKPDKLYSSNYKGQVGVMLPPYFEPFDFSYLAKRYKQLDRNVLVQDAGLLKKYRKSDEGFELLSPDDASGLHKEIMAGFFHSLYDCEQDDLILQPIPYTILFGPDETVFSYVRSENINDYAKRELFGKHSVGVGGHIIGSDAPDYVENGMERKLKQEVDIPGHFSRPRLAGTIMAYDMPIDRVHYGLVFTSHAEGNVLPREPSIASGRLVPIEDLVNGSQDKYETWSRMIIPLLPGLYKS